MKTVRRHIPGIIPYIIMAVWAMGCLTACRQKDLVYSLEPMRVAVDFDWTYAEGADPEGMTILFFSADPDSQPWRFDIARRDGGDIEIMPGRYSVLAYNSDLPGVDFIDKDSFDRFSATVRSASDSLAAPSGMLYAANLPKVVIRNTFGSRQILTLTPDSLSTVYTIRLDSVTGTERIKTAKAVLKGLARSVCLRLNQNSTETCDIVAPLQISRPNRSVLETVTTGFGNPDIHDPAIALEVIVTTSHGTYKKSFDVTRQVMNSINPKNVYIHISGLDIPAADNPADPGGDGVGIAVGVDGWQVVEITYS